MVSRAMCGTWKGQQIVQPEPSIPKTASELATSPFFVHCGRLQAHLLVP